MWAQSLLIWIQQLSQDTGERRPSKGYNPKKPGEFPSPLIAFISQTKMVANAWMRSGNTSDLNNYSTSLMKHLMCFKDHKVGLVRADSGFYSQKF